MIATSKIPLLWDCTVRTEHEQAVTAVCHTSTLQHRYGWASERKRNPMPKVITHEVRAVLVGNAITIGALAIIALVAWAVVAEARRHDRAEVVAAHSPVWAHGQLRVFRLYDGNMVVHWTCNTASPLEVYAAAPTEREAHQMFAKKWAEECGRQAADSQDIEATKAVLAADGWKCDRFGGTEYYYFSRED